MGSIEPWERIIRCELEPNTAIAPNVKPLAIALNVHNQQGGIRADFLILKEHWQV